MYAAGHEKIKSPLCYTIARDKNKSRKDWEIKG